MNKSFLKIGHRGACGYAPENTLASFRKALDLGVDMVELDVHLSSDGHLVVIHDERLDRTTNGRGQVHEKSLAELKSLDAGQGEKIPLLSEVIGLAGGKAVINVELKGAGTALPAIRLIGEYAESRGLTKESFLISSFDLRLLKEAREADGTIAIGLNMESASLDFRERAKALQASSIHPSLELASRALIGEAHAAGLKVYVWTVNESEDIERMKEYGADGVFSNFPDRL